MNTDIINSIIVFLIIIAIIFIVNWRIMKAKIMPSTVKVIKEGLIKKIDVICPECACIFECTNNDLHLGYFGNQYYIQCPTCRIHVNVNRTVKSYKNANEQTTN